MQIKKIHRTMEDLEGVAQAFNSRGDFQKNARNAYAVARKRGFLDEVCKHMKPKLKRWTHTAILEDALRYNSVGDWDRYSPAAYNAARRLGIQNEACAHMVAKQIKRTTEALITEIERYPSKRACLRHNRRAYSVAATRGILSNAIKVWEAQLDRLTLADCIDSASEFTEFKQWKESYDISFDAAKRNGWLEVCRDTITKNRIKAWRKDTGREL